MLVYLITIQKLIIYIHINRVHTTFQREEEKNQILQETIFHSPH